MPLHGHLGSCCLSPSPGKSWEPVPYCRAAKRSLALGKGGGSAGDAGDKLHLPTGSFALLLRHLYLLLLAHKDVLEAVGWLRKDSSIFPLLW